MGERKQLTTGDVVLICFGCISAFVWLVIIGIWIMEKFA